MKAPQKIITAYQSKVILRLLFFSLGAPGDQHRLVELDGAQRAISVFRQRRTVSIDLNNGLPSARFAMQ